jgi:site-specific DNA recombinase
MKKAVGYIRVSSDDQANSLIAQKEKIEAYAKFSSLELVDVFVDENVSGGMPIFERKGGAVMEAFVRKNKISEIIIVKPDRAFRDVVNSLQTMEKWKEEGVSLHISDMGGISLNTNSAIARLLFTTVISMAEFERNITGERIRTVFESKKSSGKKYSRPMYGYDNVDGMMIKNDQEQAIIDCMREWKSQGMSYAKIASNLNDSGVKSKCGKNFHTSTIKYILTNPMCK